MEEGGAVRADGAPELSQISGMFTAAGGREDGQGRERDEGSDGLKGGWRGRERERERERRFNGTIRSTCTLSCESHCHKVSTMRLQSDYLLSPL